MIEKASRTLRPLIWIGINAGIGNLDVSELTFDDLGDLDREKPFVSLYRKKTGAFRKFLLWPETVAAIKEYLKTRRGDEREQPVFLTNVGLPWVRGRVDSIVTTFTKARDAAGVDLTFYDLRRQFQTIASETLDFPAVSLVMGHKKKSTDMSARYTLKISDERIENVCNHVRAWLVSK